MRMGFGMAMMGLIGCAAQPLRVSQPDVKAPDVKPVWVDKPYGTWPIHRYHCAVGLGPERQAAEHDAYGALAKSFSVTVEAASRDVMQGYLKTGAAPLEIQSTQQVTHLATHGVVEGASPVEAWTDPHGSVYVLACLDRVTSGAHLTQQIQAADQHIGQLLQQAQGSERSHRVRLLAQALNLMMRRQAQEAQLRMLQPEGRHRPSPYSVWDMVAGLETAVDALKLGVVVHGPYQDDFRQALVEGLSRQGYHAMAVSDNRPADIQIALEIHAENAAPGKVGGHGMYFVRISVAVEVKDVAHQKILRAFQKSYRSGHRTPEEAQRQAVRMVAQQLVRALGPALDGYLKPSEAF